ncbi:Putative ribonuclease H protein At1g65750, partial [Linum grandiflorum]
TKCATCSDTKLITTVKKLVNFLTLRRTDYQFWLSVFLLPKSVIRDVEQVCSKYLLGVKEGGKKKAKVAWRTVALPKTEGGLGVRDLWSCNVACVARHIWNLLVKAGSFWIVWILTYRVKEGSVWGCSGAPYQPWVCRRYLKMHSAIFQHLSWDSDGTLLWQGTVMARYSVSRVW